MWFTQIFPTWGFNGPTKAFTNACWLLELKHWGFSARWDSPETRSGRYLLYYHTIPSRQGSKLTGSWSGRMAHHWGIYILLLPFGYWEDRKLGFDELHPQPQYQGYSSSTSQDSRVGITASGLQASHVLWVECMRPTVYDWSTLLLNAMKQQLTDCKLGKTKNFGFTSILSTLFFKRVPVLSPRVEVPPQILQGPSQTRWAEMMLRLGGGGTPTPFPPDFYHWWQQ